MTDSVVERRNDFVKSLERGLEVIRAFDANNSDLTLSDVAKSTGLTRASARRFLLTLTDLGYVLSDGRRYRLSPRVLELGYAYLSSLSIPDIARPHLSALVAEVRESSSMSVLDRSEVVYVARVPAKRIMSISISVGTRFPAFATSMGRVLLAGQSKDWLDEYLASADLTPITDRTISDPDLLRQELDRIRESGWALVDQELEEGLRALAVPVHDMNGTVVAAINVSVHTSRGSAAAARNELLPQLLAAAKAIDQDLSARRTLSSP